MVKPKKYDYTEIEYEYFDLDLCLQKAQILNLLEKSTPQKVRRFNSNGTYWVFDDVVNCFKIVINGGELYLTEYVATFMIFMDFILELLCFNDKRLICPFEDEGYFTLITITPIDENFIRCTTFDEKVKHVRNSLYITSDIVINKKTFISQLKNIIEKINSDSKKFIDKQVEKLNDEDWKVELNNRKGYYDCILDEMNIYLENPKTYKQTALKTQYLRVYDIAYKTYHKPWEFILAFDNDERGNIEYWEKLKAIHNIVDFDYIEQHPRIRKWTRFDEITKSYICGNDEIVTDFESRKLNKNWCYSPDTEIWYSENEIMAEPNTPSLMIDEFSIFGGILDDWNGCSEKELIEEFLSSKYSDETILPCYVSIKTENTIFSMEYDFACKQEIIENLHKIKAGEDVRFYIGTLKYNTLHVWHKKDNYIKILYQDIEPNYQRNTNIFQLVIDKESFIEKFLEELECRERYIKNYQKG